MARAESKMIMGYLPIEPKHHAAIISLVAPATPAHRLLDPFAGEGAFLEVAAKVWNVTPYANELDGDRSAACIARFDATQHDWAVTPNYGGKATTFIFQTSDAQATAKLLHHVMQLVNIPVFEARSGYLYDAGQRAMLVRKCRSEGGIDLLSIDLDVDAWTRLITGGLEQGVICLPESGI